jgi:hypothetical protein
MTSESGDGGLHDEVKGVTIRIFYNHETAGLAAANLEAHGIECWMNADDCGGMYPASIGGGVRLLVKASDAEAAIALLDAQVAPVEMNQIETVTPSSPKTVSRNKLAFVQILIGIVVGVLLCLFYQWAKELGTKTYFDYAADGRCSAAWVYRDGYLLEHLEDRNLDGAWDHWIYYKRGSLLRSELDNNFDGKPDEWWTYSDDGTDTLQKDTDFNGIPDEFITYKHQITQQVDIKPNGSKFTTTREIYQNGVLTEIWRGGDSNGNFKEVVRYDPFFNPISINAPAAK